MARAKEDGKYRWWSLFQLKMERQLDGRTGHRARGKAPFVPHEANWT